MPVAIESDAERKSRKRKEERDLRIPLIAEPHRREDCLGDIYKFLPTYFPGVFYQPFTVDRREMIDAILHAARYGGDQAVAGPRADGKTRSALFCALSLVLAGLIAFPMIISKSGPRAARELKNLKQAIEAAVRDQSAFALDFPEICYPIQRLERWASKARQQTAYGVFTEMEWGEECIIFPTIDSAVLWDNGWNEGIKSAATGQIMASLGIEGAIRGYSVRNKRPDVVLLDDIDDRESARSELQTDTRERIIEEDVGGLAGPDKTIARVMLCTLINRTCIAATYTDRTKKPSWRGQRHKLIERFGDREDLRDQYIDLRKNRADNDPDAREAFAFYLANQAEIEAGAVVTNPYRFDSRILLDGQPAEVSAYQSALNIIADREWAHFNTEYQNDPPAEEEISKAGITREIVRSRLSGYDRRELPPSCTIVAGIDLGKMSCHFVTGAFGQDGAGCIINYGIIEVPGTEKTEHKEVIERALIRALTTWKDEQAFDPYRDADGNPVAISQVLIDSGQWQDAVFEFVRTHGEPFRAVKGTAPFSHGQRSATRRVGNHWFAQPQPGRVWLYSLDTDHWKRSVHQRFLCEPRDADNRPNPGALTLFVPAGNRDHKTYSAHILAEEWITEFIPGKGEKSRWLRHSGNNHFYDATYLMLAAAEMAGAGMFRSKQRPPPDQRKSARQMAQEAGRMR